MRRPIAAATLTSIAILLAVATTGPVRVARAAWIALRIERGRSPDLAGDLAAAGRVGRGLGFVGRLLERHLAQADERARAAALRALARHFPASDAACAVREYEALSGRPYFGGAKARRGCDRPCGAGAVEGWRSFCARWSDFPGRDDAGLLLARCLEEAGRPREALLVLIEAETWGDGDARRLIRARRGALLARLSPAPEEVAATMAGAAPPWRLRGRYELAVAHARRHAFRRAADELRGFIAELRATDVTPLVETRRFSRDGALDRAALLAAVEPQWAAFERLAHADEAASASSGDARARALVELAVALDAEPLESVALDAPRASPASPAAAFADLALLACDSEEARTEVALARLAVHVRAHVAGGGASARAIAALDDAVDAGALPVAIDAAIGRGARDPRRTRAWLLARR